jgi:hypothetical protein
VRSSAILGGASKVWGVAILILFLPGDLGAQPAPTPDGPRFAQFNLLGAGADWRQWDSFLTNVVKTLGPEFAEPRREQLRDLFLDSRYQLVETLSSGVSDPVPRLFLDTWGRLEPILKQAVPEVPQQVASRYTGFISAMDGVASLGGVAQGLGLLRVTPDALRGASALLGTKAADPLAYTLDVDSRGRWALESLKAQSCGE